MNRIASLAVSALSDEQREQMGKDVKDANKRSEDNARTRG